MCSLYFEGMPEQMASFFRDEKLFSIKRDGTTFVETMKIDGVDTEIRLPPFDNEIEWKDKDQDPIFHVKVQECVSLKMSTMYDYVY